MKTVDRSEIIDFATYEDDRDDFREKVLAAKGDRRVHVGANLTFLFENRLTVRYQVQEMMRTERIVREADIEHELATYNELLGGPGELGCTLLIEIDDPDERTEKLAAWLALPQHLYAKLEDGTLVRATFDDRQIGERRLSAVHYIKFDTKGAVPVALGSDLPALIIEAELSGAQRQALAADLAA